MDFGTVKTISSLPSEYVDKQPAIPPFYGCTKLETVVLRSVQSIGSEAFRPNDKIREVTVSKSAQIGWDAFPEGCKITKLKALSASGGNGAGQKRGAKRARGAEN